MDSRTDEFERLYRLEGGKLWRSLFAYAGDPEVVDDAIGEAFAQAIARSGEIRDPSAWIWRVSFLLAGRELTRRSTLTGITDTATYEMADSAIHLIEALRRLSPKQRAAVVLHDYADIPTEEVAAVLGTSRATVYVHLSNGRRRLRSLVEETDD